VGAVTDFLLELRCEEIPARMQAGARADLEKLFRAEMTAAGISIATIVGAVEVWSTPRRLALIARHLPEATEAVREETKGPRTTAPEQALEGFLRKSGLTKDQLEERDGIYYAVVEKPGRAVKAVLADAIPAIVAKFPWPKSMRWGAASLATDSPRWVRPLSGIVAIFGEDLVECQVGEVASGYMTLGHRFHCPGPITIGGASDYQEKLRACHVIVDHAEREALIRERAAQAAADAGLTLVADEGLVIENAGLTEWPVPLVGRFDPAFLDVPPEVIKLTARTNQKYFVCEQPGGELADAFVCTANIESSDPAVIVAGNRKVLAARLSDARFFWDQDRKTSLADHARKLERITFHEKLGTVADKVERVAKLARWLVEEGIVQQQPSPPSGGEGRGGAAAEGRGGPQTALASTAPHSPLSQPSPPKGGEGYSRAELADLAEQAARLAKADLVTEMVGEFPELQGLMGGYYARSQGLPAEVADAIRDHYKPVGQGDEVPTAPVTVAVSLADKLDTLAAFFAIHELPSGSRDPFALRRAAIAILRLVLDNDLRISLRLAFEEALGPVSLAVAERVQAGQIELADLDFEAISKRSGRTVRNIFDLHDSFMLERFEGLVDFPIGLVRAAVGWGLLRGDPFAPTDFARLRALLNALQSFIGTEDGANLHAGYKRAANILKKEDWQGIEGEIARTGEEDPLAMVDDPDLAPVIAAKMDEKHAKQLSYTPEPAENDLHAALDSAEPDAAAAIEAEDFERAMRALASLRAPIDRFFDTVTVNDEDRDKRAARLDLLARFRAAVHNVADFSKIEG
jgi:glycyl-tRNA synthetase beta chain